MVGWAEPPYADRVPSDDALASAVRLTAEAAGEHAAGLAELLARRGLTVATAESLTGGTIASALAAAPDAAEWFRGCVVAYSAEVKVEVLGVPPGPVVTRTCATTMARAAADLLGADVCVAVTGLGGPDPDPGEDEPPGTVWLAVVGPDGAEHAERRVFPGDPADVVTATTARALALLREAVG